MSARDVIDLIDAKFRSGNSVPVERVTITRVEFDAAIAKPFAFGIQRFTATGFNQTNQCAEVTADDYGAWVLFDEIVYRQDIGTIPPIELDGARAYIPLPGGWEVQTKGGGSSFRIANTKNGERLNIPDSPYLHETLEQMAREIHTACTKKETA